jgi:cysteine synthase A
MIIIFKEKNNMSKIYKSVIELVGHTPLIELVNFEKNNDLKATLIAKVEGLNPAGSVKDRVAKSIIEDYEQRGILKPGSTIIEPTSGNTGIGLTALAIRRGYKVIIVMPDTMSVERRNLMKAYGATVELTPGKLGMKGAIARAEELNKEIPNSFIPGQFVNMANPQAHYKTTGPEIWNDTEGNVDYFVAGVGTGGTISGTAKFLKEQKPSVKAIAVEPESSPVLSLGTAGPHKIQGIGAGFIPATLNTKIYDEVVRVSNEAAFETARLLARREGLLTGISSGAALSVGIELAKKPENKGKTIVVLLPDSGDRYLSNELYNFGE